MICPLLEMKYDKFPVIITIKLRDEREIAPSFWCIGHATLVMVTLQSFGECNNLTYELPLREAGFRSLKTSSQNNLSQNLHSINVTNPTSGVHTGVFMQRTKSLIKCILSVRLKVFSLYYSQRLFYHYFIMIKAYQPQFGNCGSWLCLPGFVGIVKKKKSKWNLWEKKQFEDLTYQNLIS